jgi:aryl-alcohol dehydrogenase-like predicted oxidoreductase
MKYRAFGKTGLSVSEISLGGLFFGKLDGGKDVSKTIAAAVETGMNLIDTAPAYDGSEEALGKVLQGGLREKFILATKWWPYEDDGQALKNQPEALREAVEGSLVRLKTDRIDCFMFHSVTHQGDVDKLLQEPMQKELESLKKEGKIRFAGVSQGDDPDGSRLKEAVESGRFDFIMPEFLALKQATARNVFPSCTKAGSGVISIMPLGQAAWGYGLRDRATLKASIQAAIEKKQLSASDFPEPEKALDFLLDGQTKTIAAAGIRYCLSFPEVSTVCCGTNDPEHVRENALVSQVGPYDAAKLAQVEKLFGKLV